MVSSGESVQSDAPHVCEKLGFGGAGHSRLVAHTSVFMLAAVSRWALGVPVSPSSQSPTASVASPKDFRLRESDVAKFRQIATELDLAAGRRGGEDPTAGFSPPATPTRASSSPAASAGVVIDTIEGCMESGVAVAHAA